MICWHGLFLCEVLVDLRICCDSFYSGWPFKLLLWIRNYFGCYDYCLVLLTLGIEAEWYWD